MIPPTRPVLSSLPIGIRPSPISPEPSSPPGRKISTRTSTANVITSFSWNGEGTSKPVSSSGGPTDLQQPEEEAAERGAADAADAAQHGGGERRDPGRTP